MFDCCVNQGHFFLSFFYLFCPSLLHFKIVVFFDLFSSLFDVAEISRICGLILDKSDMAFTRSRSSSTSSLENQTNEAVTTLTFADTLARKLGLTLSLTRPRHELVYISTLSLNLLLAKNRHGRFGFVVGRYQSGFCFGYRHQFGRTGRTSPYSTGYDFA